MSLNFRRVRSASDIIISSSLIISGVILMFSPSGVGMKITGFFLLLIGILFSLQLKSVYKLDRAIGTFNRKELYFRYEDLENIKKELESNRPQIDMQGEGKEKAVKLDIYYSINSGKAYIQLFEYLPYTYEPVTEIKAFTVSQIENLIK